MMLTAAAALSASLACATATPKARPGVVVISTPVGCTLLSILMVKEMNRVIKRHAKPSA